MVAELSFFSGGDHAGMSTSSAFAVSAGPLFPSPRLGVWVTGVFIFIFVLAIAFLGYVLPWGQMSFWGATVITSMLSALPLVGDPLVQWVWGGFSLDNAALNRFMAFHRGGLTGIFTRSWWFKHCASWHLLCRCSFPLCTFHGCGFRSIYGNVSLMISSKRA